jgi:hypothetical protein
MWYFSQLSLTVLPITLIHVGTLTLKVSWICNCITVYLKTFNHHTWLGLKNYRKTTFSTILGHLNKCTNSFKFIYHYFYIKILNMDSTRFLHWLLLMLCIRNVNKWSQENHGRHTGMVSECFTAYFSCTQYYIFVTMSSRVTFIFNICSWPFQNASAEKCTLQRNVLLTILKVPISFSLMDSCFRGRRSVISDKMLPFSDQELVLWTTASESPQ